MTLLMRLMAILAALCLAAAASAESTAIVNVNVLPMTTDQISESQTVVVTDGIIVSIGDVDDIAVPVGATVVDGTDRFLMPGLTEMHGHVTGTGSREVERLFSLFLANGVTTVRGMLGRPSHLALRTSIASGSIFGPRLITSGPSLNGTTVHGAADGERQVREQHAAGYDFIKIHPGLDAAEFNAIADAANLLDMPFAGHVPVSVGVPSALNRGIATIDHLDGYMAALLPADRDSSGGYGGFFDVMLADQVVEERIEEIVAATVAAGVAIVPTQSLFEHRVSSIPAEELGSRPEMRFMSAGTVRNWVRAKQRTINERGFDSNTAARAIAIRRKLILALYQAGATLLLGSDAPQVFNVPGFSVHHELAFLVAAGMTPYQALQSGTIAPAQFFGVDTGTVEVGKIGDLVVLDANPLDDISNSRRVHGVLVRGKWARSSTLLGRIK
ncbi:MAG: amidohydrolase family protein [Gammaproteobacteria bacterium]|nr:amidohydrolase family protein [Gammaproteobacteria bacterium]